MGIYILNMEMPKTCFSCSFNDGLFCSLIDNDSDALLSDDPVEEISTSRLYACPLIEIPTPHGRLIDANKLEAMMYHEAFETDSDMQKWDSGCWIRYKVFENCMNRLLPDTILVAEE